MSLDTEQILESLLSLERSRQYEKNLRVESETLLRGLHDLAGSHDTDSLFESVVDTLRTVIDFENAMILQLSDLHELELLASTIKLSTPVCFTPSSLFKRALRGAPVASFDIQQVTEWQQQPKEVTQGITSALHIGLKGGDHLALLIVTHSAPKHFGPDDIRKAKRFAPLASQAFFTLELQQLIIQRDRFFQLSMDLMGIIDKEGIFKQFSNGWVSLLGYDSTFFQENSIYTLIHPEDIESIQITLQHLHSTGERHLIEARFKNNNGSYIWLSCSLAGYSNEELCYIVARDVTNRVIFEQRLEYDANHDALTGLYNRSVFLQHIKAAFARARRQPDYKFAIFYLDLDQFKMVNDTMGHDVGDALLKKFSRCVMEVVREVDTVARMGGDEFTILLDDVKTNSDVTSVAKRLQEKLSDPMVLKGHQLSVSASIGIAINAARYTTATDILKKADSAMYTAKSSPDLDYCIYNKEELR